MSYSILNRATVQLEQAMDRLELAAQLFGDAEDETSATECQALGRRCEQLAQRTALRAVSAKQPKGAHACNS